MTHDVSIKVKWGSDERGDIDGCHTHALFPLQERRVAWYQRKIYGKQGRAFSSTRVRDGYVPMRVDDVGVGVAISSDVAIQPPLPTCNVVEQPVVGAGRDTIDAVVGAH